MTGRARTAALHGALAGAVALAGLWLHLRLGAGSALLGQGDPLTPSLRVTEGTILRDSALSGGFVGLGTAVAGLIGPRVALLAFLPLWLFAAEGLAGQFVPAYGATWAPGEALRAFLLHPVWTPVCLLASVLVLGAGFRRRRA